MQCFGAIFQAAIDLWLHGEKLLDFTVSASLNFTSGTRPNFRTSKNFCTCSITLLFCMNNLHVMDNKQIIFKIQ